MQGNADDDKVLYIQHSDRQFYCVRKAVGRKAGWVRWYNRPVSVESGKQLGLMVSKADASSEKEWLKWMWPWEPITGPDNQRITPDMIICLTGVSNKLGSIRRNFWYVAFRVGDGRSHDHLVARHIPSSVYLKLVKQINECLTYEKSSLLKMIPKMLNKKPMNPYFNKLSKCTGVYAPRSSLVVPARLQWQLVREHVIARAVGFFWLELPERANPKRAHDEAVAAFQAECGNDLAPRLRRGKRKRKTLS